MPDVIDAYSHVTSGRTLDALEAVHPSEELDSLRVAPRMTAVDDRVEHLDRHGVDRQVISQVPSAMWGGVEPAELLEPTRVANDELRRIADAHPDRFLPIGHVPGLAGEYVAEARRCVEDLGFHGVQVFSNVGGRPLADEAFEPFWAAVDDLGAPVWIHPAFPAALEVEPGWAWIDKMLAWPFDTSVAVARLVFSGVLDRHRNVELVTHHLGGTLPYLVGRLHSWYRTRREEPELYADPTMADLGEPLGAYLERVYGDTAVSSVGESYPLRCGLEFFGVDNVLFGYDYPFGPDRGEYWPGTIRAAVEDLGLPAAETERILAGNARRLLDL